MPKPHPGFRLFVLGAGFSRRAGLPLGNELFKEVKSRIERDWGKETKFQRDLEDYLEYRRAITGTDVGEHAVDLEQLMSYLDIEHYLQFRGSDTWSDEGNESQLMIRRAIGETIYERTPPSDCLPDEYYKFAENLSVHDTIITLNYDTIVEDALEVIGRPYKLCPHRYKSIGRHSHEVDSEREEITILKLHGSIDWFDDRTYLARKASQKESGTEHLGTHTVFDSAERYGLEPLIEGLCPPDEPLEHIYRLRALEEYYTHDRTMNAPFILSPSYVKFVYAAPLISLWRGIGRAGGYNLGASVIGFSLPEHDEHIRIALYQVISNYQWSSWDNEILGVLKDNVRLVDYRSSIDEIDEYKRKFAFVDESKAAFHFDGFGPAAIDFLFANARKT